MKKQLTILLIAFIGLFHTYGQSFELDFQKGKNAFRNGRLTEADKYFVKCYRQDSTRVDLLLNMLRLAQYQQNMTRQAFVAKKLKHYLPEQKAEYAFLEVDLLFKMQKIEKAEKALQELINTKELAKSDAAKANKMLSQIHFAKEAYKHPVPFKPVNLGSNVNSRFAEYLPVMTQDGRYLIYTRHLPRSYAFPSLQEDFYISEYKDSVWTKASALSTKVNTEKNEGAPSISADGKILYFGACNRKDSKNSCDIYYSYNRGNYWTTPKNIKAINTDGWESQPNISADGRTLYFVSDRPGGEGGRDIWASEKQADGQFGEPYNLGNSINTAYDEISPYLHFDMQTLYFSSDGWPGMGSKDIFVSRLAKDGQWSEPENLGYPINSTATDNSFFVDATGETAYFSSKREGGYGEEDLYKIALPQAIQAQRTAAYKIKVLNSANKALPVKYMISTKSGILKAYTGEALDGEISLSIKANETYKISLFSGEHMFFSTYLDAISEDNVQQKNQTVHLEPIAQNKSFVLENIEFDFDRSSLRESSINELNLFAAYLKINPKMDIRIEGHTDQKGTKAYNLNLSKQRAEAVKQKLVELGVEANRLQTQGFGAEQPLFTEVEMQYKNRRVLVRVVNY